MQVQKKQISFLQNTVPQLIPSNVHGIQPVVVLVWKVNDFRAELTRTFIVTLRSFVYLWSTVTLASLVLLPVAHATTWFMCTVGVLLYDGFVLLALECMPGVVDPIEEVTVR
jgi:hypothetical protein